jgi:hypothetical protein
MTMPADYPMKIYHGDSYEWQFKLWLDEGKTQPLDLTGVVPKAEIRNKSAGTQIYIIDCTIVYPNIVAASLSASVCVTIPLGNLVWDLQLTYPTGAVNTILAGTVIVTGDVTDSVVPPPIGPTMMTATTAPAVVSLREARKK